MSDTASKLDKSLDEISKTSAPASGGGRGRRPQKCFNCGKLNHIAADCTAAREDTKKCYTCGSTKHLSKECTAKPESAPSVNEMECYNCKGIGHLARECPSENKRDAALECYTCKKKGHVAKNCPSSRETCRQCGRPGHFARDCRAGAGKAATQRRPRSRSPGHGATGRSATASGSRVYVGNLSYETTWQNLKDHMGAAGRVNHADVLMGNDGRSRGCGIVEYAFPSDVEVAIRDLTDTELDGRKIFVREDREDKQPAAAAGASGVSLYIGNLDYSASWQDLKDAFRTYGVQRADVPMQGGKSKGYGLVTVDTKANALAAIAALNSTELKGRNIHVRLDREA